MAFGRNEDKLNLAKQNGADHAINIKDKKVENIHDEVNRATGRKEIDVVIDLVGTEESIPMGFSMLAIAGTYVSAGLIGNQIKIPLFPLVAREYQYYGSFWGNYNDLREVMELAKQGLIKHHIQKFDLFKLINLSFNGVVIFLFELSYASIIFAFLSSKTK